MRQKEGGRKRMEEMMEKKMRRRKRGGGRWRRERYDNAEKRDERLKGEEEKE